MAAILRFFGFMVATLLSCTSQNCSEHMSAGNPPTPTSLHGSTTFWPADCAAESTPKTMKRFPGSVTYSASYFHTPFISVISFLIAITVMLFSSCSRQ